MRDSRKVGPYFKSRKKENEKLRSQIKPVYSLKALSREFNQKGSR